MIRKRKLKDKIENMRDKLNAKLSLDDESKDYQNEILDISQQLDELILEYMKKVEK
ncbi:aspartyl-phosphate phosphatase Spo0E family protein [Clostridium oryzae]|uniref:Spo0E like sporulation regulatory protein n=1 Tax=Clostridium oryzae TaxID=1450648 RepID=A0A1V4IE85_9CLOT|nr:aspartyl-phosphate phosphatase Spo0E family protein [Clostridium oryzae]OPJ58174.1 hypothetical protein CLORY_37380 [Clostridium oryzae]